MLVTKQDSPEDGDGEDSSPAGGEGGLQGGEGAAGDGDRDGVPLVELKSFTTQAFFACWRAVHLGILQVGKGFGGGGVRFDGPCG